ncbi:MAG: tripartite tricarboxylate transporter substrate binding protein [Hylemonella sp.]|nr:tripartite tricarboxylate transporter substrate binding protein [Hylemonella sp.]
MQRRHFIQASLLASAVPAAWAQPNGAFPDKPVKFILSQPPGSGPDNVARLLGDRLARALGQPMVIENKPGGQNIIGAQAAARSPADGYSLYFATTAALVTNKYLFKTMPYDPEKDFVPVAFIAKSPFAVVVKAESPITSMQDLIARSKAEPGKVSLANEGPRTFGGIIARVINARTQMQANLVGYASVGVAVQNLIGGHADVAVADVASTAALVRQGRLRYLAVTAAKRVAGWEQVPALSELLPGFEMVGWFAVVAPAGTPASAIQRMNKEINTLLGDADVAQRMATIGPIAESMGAPEQTGAFLTLEHQRWSRAAQEIGLLPE